MDLNLLTALDALLEENSVQAAADRLHLSPPAMSRALTRIRKATGDEILVRTGRTMSPTPRALAIRDEVRATVRRAEELLSPARTLDLPNLRRTFTIQGHDALLGELSWRLLDSLTDAPGVSLRFLAEPATDTTDLVRGHVDLDVGAAKPAAPGVSHEVVGHDHLVAVFRAGHALDGEFDIERFAAADHIIVSRRGRLRDGLDDRLAEHGLERRVVSVVPTISIALHTVAHSDTVVVVASRMSDRTLADLGLRAQTIDVEMPSPSVVLSWHSRYDDDPAHGWLREKCTVALRDALTGPAGLTKPAGPTDPAE
ncbi:LysR family transcriptional regulator [Streptomyces sp. NPDC090083]|uniref:LysR family transcriptional regulator n=1 Tax=Streptomyces sp. NPDC090083 TaxID=3365941 RepID=UPI0037FA83E1